MAMHVTSRVRWIVLGTLAALAIGLAGTSAWALGPGAPPVIKYASVEVVTTFTWGTPQLWASVAVEVPGGGVPTHIQSATVMIPGGPTFTIPFSGVDLYPYSEYFINLTASGVSGFPAGTYTFSVTDTAGGVSTATDDLAHTAGLPATSSISISGLIPVPPAAGTVYLLNLATNPTPTITWAAVPGAATHRLRVRNAYNDVDLFSRYTGAGTSLTLPAGVMVPGRRYVVRVDAYDHPNGTGCSTPPYTCQDSNARSKNWINVLTQGPEMYLTFGSGTYGPGQTLDVTTRIYNTGPTVTVDALAWIGLPTGAVMKILDVDDLVIPTNLAGDFYSGTIGFSYTFTGSEPSGIYVVGLRLTDPATGETVAKATRTFAK
jgi:hypothetical protein